MRPSDQSTSPVLAMSPQAPPQPSFNMDFTSPFANSKPRSPMTSWTNSPHTSAPPSAAGRKRSRDEAASNLEEDYFEIKRQPPAAQAEPENEDDWTYGVGMNFIRRSKAGAYTIDAGSQTGTSADEKAEKAQVVAPLRVERPIVRANKSQRLNLSTTLIIAEESAMAAYPSPGSPERFKEPTIDDFTRHLGIGWSSANSLDAATQAAARGWEKYIENHYPVTNARIKLQSKGLASYLVETNEGYFLFGEDLRQGRLVSTSLERTWVNLSSPVPIFEGASTMEAGQTPECSVTPIMNELDVMNGAEVDVVNPNGAALIMKESDGMSGVQTDIVASNDLNPTNVIQPSNSIPNGTIDFASDGTHAINLLGATNVNSVPSMEGEMDMS